MGCEASNECVRICITCAFSHIGKRFSSGRGSFIALSAAGHAGGPACTNFGKRLDPGGASWRVFGALESRASWFFFGGTAVRYAEPRRTVDTPHFQLFALPLSSHRPSSSSSLLCGRHGGTTAVAHEALAFVTATDGASVCAYV